LPKSKELIINRAGKSTGYIIIYYPFKTFKIDLDNPENYERFYKPKYYLLA
jgi:hypothetical protein